MHFNFKRITAVVLAFALTFSLLITVFANTFTVTFHANGGTGALSPESREIPAGQRLTGTYAPPAAGSQVTRSGYVLAQTPEWFTNASGTGTAWNLNTDIISKDENLYLNWRRLWPVTLEYGQVETEHIINPNPVTFSRHSITYTNEVANGEALAGYAAHPGSQINNPVSIDSITVSTANAPRTLGLLFDGWYTDPDFTNAANLLNPVTSALNLFAKWKPANNVYFDLNYDIFPLTEKYDEELEEWVPDEKPLADAIYDEDKDSYFMPVLKTTTTKGQIAAQVLDDTRIPPYMRPADPVRTAAGWNFIGWYDHPTIPVNRWDRDANNTLTWTNRVPVENNLTLYAHWERPINVTFDFNFGVTSPKLELAAAQKPLSGKGIHVNNRPANATNPTGIYRKPSVGACPHWDTVCESSATCKETEALPVNGNRHGNEWSLEGWYTTPGGPEDGEKWIFNTGYAPNEVVGTLVGSEDLTLYAHWVESYEVTYDIGQVDPASLNTPSFYSPFRYIAPPGKTIETTDTFINVLPYQLSLNSFIAKKHIFVGWFKDSPAFKNQWVTTGTTPDVLTKDTTLYAGWLANVDGTVDSGTAANEIIFDWNFDPDSPTTVTSQLNSRLVPQGGTGKDLYFNNVKSTVPPSVYRTGYNFEGWFTDKKGTAPWNSDNIVADGTIVYAKWSQRITVEFYVLDEHTIYGSSPLRENPAGSGRISNIQLNSGQTVSNPINDSNRNAVIFGYTIESWCFHDYDCGKNADCAWDFSKPIQVTHEENDALFMRLYVNVIESVVIFYNVNWPEGSGTHFMDGWLPDFAEFYNMEKLKKFSDIKGGWLATPVTVPGGPSTGTRVNQMRPGDTLISPPTELNETATRENNVNVPIIGAPPDDLPYQFTGWYRTKETADNNDQNGLFKFGAGQNTITEDIVLFAGWRSSYAVTFNANLPNGIIQQVDVPDPIYVQPPGGRITNPTPDDRPENQPQLTGYAFDGWYKTKAAADALDPNGLFKFQSGATGDVVNQNTTLYAGWVEARLISFNLGPGVPGIPPQARMVGLGRLVPPPSLVTRGEG
ncbi:MAG: InlB B-repeat-containing protein, partial [Oscillospiraceae bacterium]|nr:InlB B-repeat-containing protein [Oscillospiraceae bacterium]